MALAIGAGPAPVHSAVVMPSEETAVVSMADVAPGHAVEQDETLYPAAAEYKPVAGTLVDITHLYLPYDNKRSVEASYLPYGNVRSVSRYLPYD